MPRGLARKLLFDHLQCTQCRRWLDIDKFPKSRAGIAGRKSHCIQCVDDNYIQRAYGISKEQYDSLLSQQDYACAICKRKNTDGRRLYIDHNHETGEVRGLLCLNCNFAIGYLHEEIDLLEKIKIYLSAKAEKEQKETVAV